MGVAIEIVISVNGRDRLRKVVYTDAMGYFLYAPTSTQYWIDFGFAKNENDVKLSLSGTGKTTYSRYSRDFGTNFVEGGCIDISVGKAKYSEDVIVEMGYSQIPVIGDIAYKGGEWFNIG